MSSWSPPSTLPLTLSPLLTHGGRTTEPLWSTNSSKTCHPQRESGRKPSLSSSSGIFFLPTYPFTFFSVRWVCALPPISNSPSLQQLYVVNRPLLSCSPPSPSPMSSLRCHQTSKPTLRVILGEGGAHTSPEQSEGHYRRLQLLWQCLCSNPSNEIQFRLGGLSFSVSILA